MARGLCQQGNYYKVLTLVLHRRLDIRLAIVGQTLTEAVVAIVATHVSSLHMPTYGITDRNFLRYSEVKHPIDPGAPGTVMSLELTLLFAVKLDAHGFPQALLVVRAQALPKLHEPGAGPSAIGILVKIGNGLVVIGVGHVMHPFVYEWIIPSPAGNVNREIITKR